MRPYANSVTGRVETVLTGAPVPSPLPAPISVCVLMANAGASADLLAPTAPLVDNIVIYYLYINAAAPEWQAPTAAASA